MSHALVAQDPVELRPAVRHGLEPAGSQDEDRLLGQPPQREAQHRRRGGIDPLQVVDGHDQRPAERQRAQRRERRHPDRPLVHECPPPRTPAAQERALEGEPLRSGQARRDLVEVAVQEVAERGEGQARLGACGRAGEDPPAAVACLLHRPSPQRGLSDPGFSLEHGRARAYAGTLQRLEQNLELAISPDQRSRRAQTPCFALVQ